MSYAFFPLFPHTIATPSHPDDAESQRADGATQNRKTCLGAKGSPPAPVSIAMHLFKCCKKTNGQARLVVNENKIDKEKKTLRF